MAMSDAPVNATSSATQPTLASTTLAARLKRAFGPVLPGLVLDLADLCSLTRYVGPWASFPLGFAIGIWLSLFYPFGFGGRLLVAIGSGLYTLTPGTEYIPLATILTCLGRFIESAPEAPATSSTGETAHREDAPLNSAPEPARPKREAPTSAACPECGSTSLKYGQVAQRFWPSGSGAWAKGHEVNAFVCLECGFVGHFLVSSDLEKLRDDQSP